MATTAETFRAFDFLRRRKRNYQLCFGAPGGQAVLEDLARFCRANESCFHADPRVHAVLEGRREVFLRVSQHLNLTAEQLFALLDGRQLNLANKENDNE